MENKLTTRSTRFDECVAELSPATRGFFRQAVLEITEQLANGGGEMSAKEVLYQLAFTGLYKEKQMVRIHWKAETGSFMSARMTREAAITKAAEMRQDPDLYDVEIRED